MVTSFDTGDNTADDDRQLKDYADELIEEYNLKTLNDTDEIWWYDPKRGIYLRDAESIIKARIEHDKGMPYFDENGEMKESKLTKHQIQEYLGHIQRRTYIARETFNPSIEWLACDNCMVNVITGDTQPFSPDFMNTTHIPVKYVSYGTGYIADFFSLVECHCPTIMKFLHGIISPEDVDIVLDFMAYCLWREYKSAFWILFHGEGFNGKSIFFQLIENFLGKDNVSGETLERLIHGKYSTANLYLKMANVDADVSEDLILNNTGIIKKLTGNDLHPGEFKFKNAFAFRNYAKLWFSCNKIPKIEDYTDAFFRRFIIINFTQQFFGEKDDPDLIAKLCTKEELSGLLHELLIRLPRVLKEGIKKITSEVMEETYDKYIRSADPVKYFVDRALESIPGCKVTKLELFEHYDKFRRKFNLAVESPRSLSLKLTQEHHYAVKRGRVNNEPVWLWDNVRLKDWEKEERSIFENLEEFQESMK